MKTLNGKIVFLVAFLILSFSLAGIASGQEGELPDLTATAIEAPSSAGTQEQIEVSWTVENQGNGTAQLYWFDSLYLSADDKWDANDALLTYDYTSRTVLAGDNYTVTLTASIPSVPAGTYYLLIATDWWYGSSYIYESNEQNNLLARQIIIGVPDLVVTAVEAPASASTQQQIEVFWTIENQGNGIAEGWGWISCGVGGCYAYGGDHLYLSTDDQLGGDDTYLGVDRHSDPLPAGESFTTSMNVTIPNVAPGTYYLLVEADYDDKLYESNEYNNILAQQITVLVPDLVVTALAPTCATTQHQIEVFWTIENQGDGIAEGWGWISCGVGGCYACGGDYLCLSTDDQLGGDDTYLGVDWHSDPLPAGESFTTSMNVTIPNVAPGTYYLLVEADYDDKLYESNEYNNILAQQITVLVPDLVVTAIDAPTSGSTQQQIEVSWTVQNQGTGYTPIYSDCCNSGWRDPLYLSLDNQWDQTDMMLGASGRIDILSVGATYTQTLTVTVPNVPAGSYYLLACTDWLHLDIYYFLGRGSHIYESNEDNNILAQVITIQAPDLVVTAIDAPASVSTQEQLEVSWTVENHGDGIAQGYWGYWYDSLYLSANDQWDTDDTWLTYSYTNRTVLPGDNYTATRTALIPTVPAGTYYLLVKTAGSNYLYECNEDNNVLAQPITIHVPDLVVTFIGAPASISSQETIQVSWTVENQGDGDAKISRWYDRIYLSTDDQLDDSDTCLGWWWRTSLPAGGSHMATYGVGIPEVPSGTYYLLVETDYGNYLYESREWNNILPRLITVVEEGEEGGFTETYSDETTLVEGLLGQKATLSDGTVTGDLAGTFSFTAFEIVSINSGAFSGKGFSTGQWEAMLDGIAYRGDWQGVSFLVASEGKMYLKGSISGGEARGIAEGYLTESVPGSSVYDQYQATWRLGRLADKTVSATLSLNGTLTYLEPSEYPPVEIYALQSSVDGATFGHYTESLSTVLTHLRVVDEDNPYNGQGFSIISYTSDSGQGEGWTYDKEVSPGIVEMKGLLTSPLLGIVSGILDETKTARTLSVTIERIDLGLPPMADLQVEVWGPERVSPGQTVDYIIEYRNDGVRSAENVVVVTKLPYAEYTSSTLNGIYRLDKHEVFWQLVALKPKERGYLSVKITYPWALPLGSFQNIYASIKSKSLTSSNPLFDFDLDEYLSFEPLSVTTAVTLSLEDIDAEFTKDPMFQDLFDYAVELGYNYSGVAVRTVLSNSLEYTRLTMTSPETGGVLFVTRSGTSVILEKYSEAEISFFDREGGVSYDFVDYSFSEWGTRAEKSSCSRGQCIFNCLVLKKLPFILLGNMSKKIDAALKLPDCVKCAGTCGSPDGCDWFACERCALLLKDIPGLGEAVDVFECLTDCSTESGRTEHCCDPDEPPKGVCTTDKNGEVIGGHLICVGGAWTVKSPDWGPCRRACGGFYGQSAYEACLFGLTCNDGWCDCKNIGDGRAKSGITVARDPNVKYGPEGSVLPGQKLDYTVEYENEGEGIAFGVYFTDTLDEDLDDSTLEIGPVISTIDGSDIAPAGTYNPSTRTITWLVGEVGPSEGGYAEYSANVRSDASNGTEIINFATVYFPSVPETTRTNGIVSTVGLNQPPVEVQLSLQAGWNMVSVPVVPVDNSTSAVFPGVAGIFTWNATSRSYYVPTVIDPEKGYWVAVTEDTPVTISGTPVNTWTTDIKAGWNMIGSVNATASIADPNDYPDGSVIPPAYWWDPVSKSYVLTTDIDPGKGYWLASVIDCVLTVCSCTYDLTVSSTDGGDVTIPGEGTFTYHEGEVVDLVAKGDEGCQFGSWSGDLGSIASVNAASTTITMDGSYSIKANFEVMANRLPAITNLEAEPQRVLPSGSCQIICTASDPDGGELAYYWSANGGEIAGEGAMVTWTAPNSVGPYNVTVPVTDSRGGEAIDCVTIEVRTNTPPTISSLVADPDRTLPSGTLQLTCAASDPDGDELSYEWSATGGDIPGTGAVVGWDAPQEVGVYYITAVVRDGHGASDTRTLPVSVVTGQPPSIEGLVITADHCYLRTNTSPYKVGQGKKYNIQCTVGDAGVDLFYEWSCTSGLISGEGSLITWTAPNTSGKVTITVIVSDIVGNKAAKSLLLDVAGCSPCTFPGCSG